MSTNYYFIKKCEACKSEDKIHIGKRSAGWAFMMRVYPEKSIYNIDDHLRFYYNNKGYYITSEFGLLLTISDFLGIVYYANGLDNVSYNETDFSYYDMNINKRRYKSNFKRSSDNNIDYIEGEFS